MGSKNELRTLWISCSIGKQADDGRGELVVQFGFDVVDWPAGGIDSVWTDDVGHVIDLPATCRNVAGLSSTHPGRPLTAPTDTSRTIFWEHQGQQAVRRGDWKLLRNSDEGKWELYNLRDDPTELIDLADQEAGMREDLSRTFTDWWSNQAW